MSTTIGTLTLTEFSDSENARTWVLADHTINEPRVVIQKRKIANPASTGAGTQHSELKVVYGTSDADGNPMSQKISIDTVVRYPVGATLADVQAAVDSFQILVASTNFDSLVEKQLYLG